LEDIDGRSEVLEAFSPFDARDITAQPIDSAGSIVPWRRGKCYPCVRYEMSPVSRAGLTTTVVAGIITAGRLRSRPKRRAPGAADLVPEQRTSGGDLMNKLVIVAIAASVLVVVSAPAVAQLLLLLPPQGQGQPIGERGAKWGKQCWVGDSYFGYWGTCPKPKAAPKAAKRAKAAPKS
jgi:hypothetical protein